MIARVLSIMGPPGSADESHAVVAATTVKSFQRMNGFLGGTILFDGDASCIRTIGFWADSAAIEASDVRAADMGRNLAESIFGSHGTYDLQTFHVIGVDPPPAVELPTI